MTISHSREECNFRFYTSLRELNINLHLPISVVCQQIFAGWPIDNLWKNAFRKRIRPKNSLEITLSIQRVILCSFVNSAWIFPRGSHHLKWTIKHLMFVIIATIFFYGRFLIHLASWYGYVIVIILFFPYTQNSQLFRKIQGDPKIRGKPNMYGFKLNDLYLILFIIVMILNKETVY